MPPRGMGGSTAKCGRVGLHCLLGALLFLGRMPPRGAGGSTAWLGRPRLHCLLGAFTSSGLCWGGMRGRRPSGSWGATSCSMYAGFTRSIDTQSSRPWIKSLNDLAVLSITR